MDTSNSYDRRHTFQPSSAAADNRLQRHMALVLENGRALGSEAENSRQCERIDEEQ